MSQDARQVQQRAWELPQQGWTGEAIARAFGTSEAAVHTWLKRARAGGVATLKRHPPPGATPWLTGAQRAQGLLLLSKWAEWYGFVGNAWMTKRVAAVIKREFSFTFHLARVSRLVRQE